MPLRQAEERKAPHVQVVGRKQQLVQHGLVYVDEGLRRAQTGVRRVSDGCQTGVRRQRKVLPCL